MRKVIVVTENQVPPRTRIEGTCKTVKNTELLTANKAAARSILISLLSSEVDRVSSTKEVKV